ncbi:hypothetical protein NL676_018342 [Syzygium grande]|nr:hypothetical protein NL676_018342 [Syzygium grande]
MRVYINVKGDKNAMGNFRPSIVFTKKTIPMHEDKRKGIFSSGMTRGKVAVITGGAGGIAACTARLFSKHGAKVIIADIRHHLGKSVCNNLGPDTTSFVHCYVSSESNIVDAIDTTADKHGKLDIMVNNAATGDPVKAKTLDNDKADFESGWRELDSCFLYGPSMQLEPSSCHEEEASSMSEASARAWVGLQPMHTPAARTPSWGSQGPWLWSSSIMEFASTL